MRRHLLVTNSAATSRRPGNTLRQVLVEGLHCFLLDQEERAFRSAIALEIIDDFELDMSDPQDVERLEELVEDAIAAMDSQGIWDPLSFGDDDEAWMFA